MEKLEEKVFSLQAYREIVKRKLSKLSEKVIYLDDYLLKCQSKQVAFEVIQKELKRDMESILARLDKIERDVEELKSRSHEHKVIK